MSSSRCSKKWSPREVYPPGVGGSGADFDIKVSIPLLGTKLEGIVQEETAANFKKQKTFNDDWLASH